MEENKKLFIIIGLFSLVLVAALMVISVGFDRDYDRKYNVQAKIGVMPQINRNDFVLPQDALKTGELNVMVDDIDDAKRKINEIASQNEGILYSINISYSSGQIKSGSMVLQVPEEKFETAFEFLRLAGFQVTEESIRRIEVRNIYPVLDSASEGQNLSRSEDVSEQAAPEIDQESFQGSSKVQGETESQKAIIQPLGVQNKGYINVLFTEYVKNRNVSPVSGQSRSNMMFFQSPNSGFYKAAWVAIGLKMSILVVLLISLVFVLIKMIGHYTGFRKNKRSVESKSVGRKAVVHIIRQAPKTRKKL